MENEQSQLSLENLMIAAPCDVEWKDMVGNNQLRRCNACQLNVYNVKSLTSKELEELFQSDQARNGQLCMQLYRRADGTIITADCPRGLKKIRAFSGRLWRMVAAAIAVIVGSSPALADDNDKSTAAKTDKTAPPVGTRTAGKICPPNVLKNTGKTDPNKTVDQGKQQKENKPAPSATEDTHHGKAHFTAFNLYKEGQQLEKEGAYAKAADVYQQALTLMSHEKHDPKFHLKIATALSRVKAKAGINQ